MLDAKMKLDQNPVRATGMSDLEEKFNNWEQLSRDLDAGGESFHVSDITKNIALEQLAPKEIEHQFMVASDGSLQTLSQRANYIRHRITNHKADIMSAKVLKHTPPIHQLAPGEEPKLWDPASVKATPTPDLVMSLNTMNEGEYWDEAIVNAMTTNDLVWYMNKGKGKGKGRWGSWKGEGKGNDRRKGWKKATGTG